MSQYKELAQFLSDHKDLQKEVTSLYKDITPILRTTFAEWIEQQNWSSLISLTANSDQTDFDVVNKGTKLLNEALKLLGEKIKSSNNPELTLCIMHSKTTVKKTKMKGMHKKQEERIRRRPNLMLGSMYGGHRSTIGLQSLTLDEMPINPWSLVADLG